ncbi:ABC transporter substrate-binding protein [Roseovarius pacificus]|uniref:ABC transporter substrate-binding protein n=1 Tax=Roseovarius pacificus TaxID=337701 RepID=UPI002A18E835|nr:ABC transporter substrate-binding protein [Roseovarius pacificus]
MKKTMLLAATASLLTIAAPALAELKIGAVLSLSGPSATAGEDQRRGIELAVEEVNAAGGVMGEPVAVVIEDSGARVPSALDAAKKLVTVDNVPVVIGEYSSGITIPMATYLVQEGRVHLNIGSSSGKVRDIGDLSFSVLGLDNVSSAFAAKDLYDQGFRRIAVITPNNAFGQGTAQEFAKSFTEMGGEITTTVLYTEGQTSYRRELQQMDRTQPDAFFYSAYGKEAATINREAYELGLNQTPWYAGYMSMCTSDSEPTYVEGQMGFDLNYIGGDGASYADAYQARYGEPFVTSFSGYAYDAAKLIMQAAEEAQSTNPTDLAAKVRELGTTGFEGVTGPIKFDADGQRSKQPYLRQKFEDGKISDR